MSLFEEYPDTRGCTHEKTELARLVAANGTFHIIRRCVECDDNISGGNYLPHDRVYGQIDELPIWRDYRDTVPACERCGDRGAELHHWYPSAVDGRSEADTWPTSWLCHKCHSLWHLNVVRAVLQGRLGKA